MTILDDLYERWNEHDIDGVLSFFHDDLVYSDKTINTTFSGRQELAQFMTATFAAMPDLRFELLHTFETDSDCAGQALMIGTFVHDLGDIRATGDAFTVNYAIVGRKVAGKISELNDYWNYAEFVGG